MAMSGRTELARRVRRGVLTLPLLCLMVPVAAAEALSAGAAPAAADPASILWYRAPARCTFLTPEEDAAFRHEDPSTWRFRLIVMVGTVPGAGSAEAPERGYLMKDGLLRELEKVRSGPDAEGASVTVWRSAGEPRLNITTTLRPDPGSADPARLRGTLATIRGDGRDTIEIVGACRP